ncbi:MAG: hypothetical protein NTW17_03430 [Candidatus Pacearchaeota archaeon]|nr:hypothetical protein [Candidatus Pacearchaeota archaeon]
MKKGEQFSFIEGEIHEINHLVRVLGRHIKKFEDAYKRKDAHEFNILKKEIIQIQKKIHSIMK